MAIFIRIVVIISVLFGIGLYLNITDKEDSTILVDDKDNPSQMDNNIEGTEQNTTSVAAPKQGLGTLIGKSKQAVLKLYGEPKRIDPSAYEYDWWVYQIDEQQYFQVGILDGKVVTVYAIGADVEVAPYKIGQQIGEIYTNTPIQATVSFQYKKSTYRFELSEEEMNNEPLIKIGDYFVQLYMDKFTGTLSSIRFMDAQTLLNLKPYELEYRGDLVEVVSKGNEDEIDRGNEQQIVDISNMMRKRFDLPLLKVDDKTAKVALGHSEDMFHTEDFSHQSKKYGDLEDRLKAGDVLYQLAGENIAAGYTDGASVVEGWLNSKSHRESLLNKEFTDIGVGVYRKYYTQNFIEKW